MAITRTDRNQRFDADGNLISEEVVVVDITAPSIEYDLHAKARQRVAGIDAALVSAAAAKTAVATVRNSSPATLNAAVTELKRLAAVVDGLVDELVKSLRTEAALIRLLVGADLLVENTDT